MKKYVTALIISAFVATLATSVYALGTPSVNDYTPQQALALSSAPGGPNDQTAVQVDPQTVLGTAPASPATLCWRAPGLGYHWGLYPYNQSVNEDRTWCADYLGGPQNYRISHITLDSMLCGHSNAGGYRVSGGNGYTWTTMHDEGDFSCPTPIPWVTYHYHRWVEEACNTWGNCAVTDHS